MTETRRGPHLLGLRNLTESEVDGVLCVARELKILEQKLDSDISKRLKNRRIALLFFENSTRTKYSFELAIKKLGGEPLSFHIESSSMKKGESLMDSVQTIESLGIDAWVVRTQDSGGAIRVSEYSTKPVINAGDGLHEHPTQALVDLFTMEEVWQRSGIKQKNILIVGDILNSRVARSNIWGIKLMGGNVGIFAPTTLCPVGIETLGIRVFTSFADALEFADAVIVLRIQHERIESGAIPTLTGYSKLYGLTMQRLKNRVKEKELLIMHPGPINRGLEIESPVADSPNSQSFCNSRNLILEQVKNGIYIRMAVLLRCLEAI